MRVSSCLAIAVFLAAPLAAESRPDQPVLKDAYAVLRIADGRWVDRQVAQFAAACGQDPGPARERMSRALFYCSSTTGIDFQRPTVLAWRTGRAPLLAIIPLADRRAFSDAFGVMPADQPPLVHVDDREGTVVYTQNHARGRDEYRLLISDDTAYLARTADECRALASHPLTFADDYAVGFSAWGPFDGTLPLGVEMPVPDLLPAAASPGLRAVASAVLEQARASLPAQVTSLGWQLKVAPNGGASWSGSIQLATDSPFAEWLRAQSNQAGRLPGALPDDAPLRVFGQFAWQGQCDALGHQLIPTMRTRIGAAWTPAVEEAWITTWSLLDHLGGFAGSLRAAPQAALLSVMEHPQADLLAGQLAVVDAALEGRASEKDAAIPGWRLSGGVGSAAIGVADRAVVVASSADASAPSAAQAALGRAASAAPAAGVPALLTASLDFTQLVSQIFADRIDTDSPLPRAAAQLVIKVGHDELQAQCELPLGDASAVLGKLNWK